jgi:hypothetical protein
MGNWRTIGAFLLGFEHSPLRGRYSKLVPLIFGERTFKVLLLPISLEVMACTQYCRPSQCSRALSIGKQKPTVIACNLGRKTVFS